MRLYRSFGCMSLQGGTKMIGAVSLTWSLFSAMGLGMKMKEICVTVSSGEDVVFESRSPPIILAGLLVCSLVTGFTAGLSIYGVNKNNPDYIFPWLALVTSDLLITASLSFGFILIGPTTFNRDEFLILLMIISMYTGAHFYVWFVVYSMYKNQLDPLLRYEIDNVGGSLAKNELPTLPTMTKSAQLVMVPPQQHWA